MARRLEQIAHHVLGRVRARCPTMRKFAPRRFTDTRHAVFDEAQIFIERAAQIREPRVVGRHEIEFAHGFDGSGSGHH